MMKIKLQSFAYWLIQLTWGIITTVLGFLLAFILRLFNCPMYKNGYGYITTVGGNWGGLSLGPFAFCGRYEDKNSTCYNIDWFEHTRCHEFGHSLQVLFLGPLWLFVVAIPSAVRYWYYRIKRPDRDYDSIWFERTATKWGTDVIKKIESK